MYEKFKEYWLYLLIWLLTFWVLWVLLVKTYNERTWAKFYENVQDSVLLWISQSDKLKQTLSEKTTEKLQDFKFWEYSIDTDKWIYVLNWVNIDKWILENKLAYWSEKWLLSDLYSNETDKNKILNEKKLVTFLLPWKKINDFSKAYDKKNWWYIIKWKKVILWNWTELETKEANDLEKWYIWWSLFWVWYFKSEEEAKAFQEKYFPTNWYVFWWKKTPIVAFEIASDWWSRSTSTPSWWWSWWWTEPEEIEDREYFCTLPLTVKNQYDLEHTLENSWNTISIYSRWSESDYLKVWKYVFQHWYLKQKFEFTCTLNWKTTKINKEIIERHCDEWYTYNNQDNNPKCLANKHKLRITSNLNHWITFKKWTETITHDTDYEITFWETTSITKTLSTWYIYISKTNWWLSTTLSDTNWDVSFTNPNNDVLLTYKILKQCETPQTLSKWWLTFAIWKTVFDSRQWVNKSNIQNIVKWKVKWIYDFSCTDDWILTHTENYEWTCNTWYTFNWDFDNPKCEPSKHALTVKTTMWWTIDINWDQSVKTEETEHTKAIQWVYDQNYTTSVSFDTNTYYLHDQTFTWITWCTWLSCSFTMPNNEVTLKYEIKKYCVIPNTITEHWYTFNLWTDAWRKIKEWDTITKTLSQAIENWNVSFDLEIWCNADWTLKKELKPKWNTSTWCNFWYEYSTYRCVWRHWTSWTYNIYVKWIDWVILWRVWTFQCRHQTWYKCVLWYVSSNISNSWKYTKPYWILYDSWIIKDLSTKKTWDWFELKFTHPASNHFDLITYFYENCPNNISDWKFSYEWFSSEKTKKRDSDKWDYYEIQNWKYVIDDHTTSSWNRWYLEIWTTKNVKIFKWIPHWYVEWNVWVECKYNTISSSWSLSTKLSDAPITTMTSWKWYKYDYNYIKNTSNWSWKQVKCHPWYHQKWSSEECEEDSIWFTVNISFPFKMYDYFSDCSTSYWSLYVKDFQFQKPWKITFKLIWKNNEEIRCKFKWDWSSYKKITWTTAPRKEIRDFYNKDRPEIEIRFRVEYNTYKWQKNVTINHSIYWYEYCEARKNIQKGLLHIRYKWWSSFDWIIRKWETKTYTFEENPKNSYTDRNEFDVKFSCETDWRWDLKNTAKYELYRQDIRCNSYWYNKWKEKRDSNWYKVCVKDN